MMTSCSGSRIDGALYPWTEGLLKRLPEIFGLSETLEVIPTNVTPPARVSVGPASGSSPFLDDFLKEDPIYRTARVSTNKRTTAEDWNQDVRHIELEFEEDIERVEFSSFRPSSSYAHIL